MTPKSKSGLIVKPFGAYHPKNTGSNFETPSSRFGRHSECESEAPESLDALEAIPRPYFLPKRSPAAAEPRCAKAPIHARSESSCQSPERSPTAGAKRQRSRSIDGGDGVSLQMEKVRRAAHEVACDHGEHCLHTAGPLGREREKHFLKRYRDAAVCSFLSTVIGFTRCYPESISVANELFEEHTQLTARRECFNKFQSDAQSSKTLPTCGSTRAFYTCSEQAPRRRSWSLCR